MEDNLLDLLLVRGGEKSPQDDQSGGDYQQFIPGGFKFFVFGFSFSLCSLFATLQIIKTKLRPSTKFKKLDTGAKETEETKETDNKAVKPEMDIRKVKPETDIRTIKPETDIKAVKPDRVSAKSKHKAHVKSSKGHAAESPSPRGRHLGRQKKKPVVDMAGGDSDSQPKKMPLRNVSPEKSPEHTSLHSAKSLSQSTPVLYSALSARSEHSSRRISHNYHNGKELQRRRKLFTQTKPCFGEDNLGSKYNRSNLRSSKPRRVTRKLHRKKRSQDDIGVPLAVKMRDSNKFNRWNPSILRGSDRNREQRQNNLINDPTVLHQSTKEHLSENRREKDNPKKKSDTVSSGNTSAIVIDEFDEVSYLVASEPQDHLLFSSLTSETDTTSVNYGTIVPHRGQGEVTPGYLLKLFQLKRQLTTDDDSQPDDARHTSEFATQSSNTFTVEEAAQNLLSGVFTGRSEKAKHHTSGSSVCFSRTSIHEKGPIKTRKSLTLGERVCRKPDLIDANAAPTTTTTSTQKGNLIVEKNANKVNDMVNSTLTGHITSTGQKEERVKDHKTDPSSSNSQEKISRVRLSIRKSKNTVFEPQSTSDLSGILKRDAMLAASSPVSQKLMELRDAIINEWKREKEANKNQQKGVKGDIEKGGVMGKLMEQTKPLANVEITKVNTRKRKAVDDTDIIESHIFCHSQETLSPGVIKEGSVTDPSSTKKSSKGSKKISQKRSSREELAQSKKNAMTETGPCSTKKSMQDSQKASQKHSSRDELAQTKKNATTETGPSSTKTSMPGSKKISQKHSSRDELAQTKKNAATETVPSSTKISMPGSKKISQKHSSRDELAQSKKNATTETGGQVDACTSMTREDNIVEFILLEPCQNKEESKSKESEKEVITCEKWHHTMTNGPSNDKESKSLQSRTRTSTLKPIRDSSHRLSSTTGEPSFTLRRLGVAQGVNGLAFQREWLKNATEVNKHIQSIFSTYTDRTKAGIDSNQKDRPQETQKTETKCKKWNVKSASNDTYQNIPSQISTQRSAIQKSRSSKISKMAHNPEEYSNVTLTNKGHRKGSQVSKGIGDMGHPSIEKLQMDEVEELKSHGSHKDTALSVQDFSKETKKQVSKKTREDGKNETEANAQSKHSTNDQPQGDSAFNGKHRPPFLKKGSTEVNRTIQTQNKSSGREEFVKQRQNHSRLQSQMPKLLKQRPRVHNRYTSQLLKIQLTQSIDTTIEKSGSYATNPKSMKYPPAHSTEAPVRTELQNKQQLEGDDTKGKSEQKEKANDEMENHYKNSWLPKTQQTKPTDTHVEKYANQVVKPQSKKTPVQTTVAPVAEEHKKNNQTKQVASKIEPQQKDMWNDVQLNQSISVSCERTDMSQSTLNMLSSFSIPAQTPEAAVLKNLSQDPTSEDQAASVPKTGLCNNEIPTSPKRDLEILDQQHMGKKSILSNVCMVELLNTASQIDEKNIDNTEQPIGSATTRRDKKGKRNSKQKGEAVVKVAESFPDLHKQKPDQKDKRSNVTVKDPKKEKMPESKIPLYVGNTGSGDQIKAFGEQSRLPKFRWNRKTKRQRQKQVKQASPTKDEKIVSKPQTKQNQRSRSLIEKQPDFLERGKGLRGLKINQPNPPKIYSTREYKNKTSPIKYLMNQSEPIIIIAPHLDRSKLNLGNHKHFLQAEIAGDKENGPKIYHKEQQQNGVHGNNKLLSNKSSLMNDKSTISSGMMKSGYFEANRVLMNYDNEECTSTTEQNSSFTSPSSHYSSQFRTKCSQEKVFSFKSTLQSISEEELSDNKGDDNSKTTSFSDSYKQRRTKLSKKKSPKTNKANAHSRRLKYKLSNEQGELVEKIFAFWQSNLKVQEEQDEKLLTKSADSSPVKNEKVTFQQEGSKKKRSSPLTKKGFAKRHNTLLSLEEKKKSDNLKHKAPGPDHNQSKNVKKNHGSENNSPQKGNKPDSFNKHSTHSNTNMSTSNAGATAALSRFAKNPILMGKRSFPNTRGYLRSTHSYDQKKIKSDISPRPAGTKSKQKAALKKEQVDQLLAGLPAELSKQLKADFKKSISKQNKLNVPLNLGMFSDTLSPRQSGGEKGKKSFPLHVATSPLLSQVLRPLLDNRKKAIGPQAISDKPEVNVKKHKSLDATQRGQKVQTDEIKDEIRHKLEHMLTSRGQPVSETSPTLNNQGDSTLNTEEATTNASEWHKSKILNDLVDKMMKLVHNRKKKPVSENSSPSDGNKQKDISQETHTLRSSPTFSSPSPKQVLSPGVSFFKAEPAEETKSKGDDTFSFGSKRTRQRHFNKTRLLKWGELGTSHPEVSKVKRLTKSSLVNPKEPLETVEFTSHASLTSHAKDKSRHELSKFSSPELLTMPRSKSVRIHGWQDDTKTDGNRTTAEDTLLGSSKWSVEGLSTDASPFCSAQVDDPREVLLPNSLPKKLDRESNDPSTGTPNLEMYKKRITKTIQAQNQSNDVEVWDSGHETSHVDKLREKYLREIKMRLRNRIDREYTDENQSQHSGETNSVQNNKMQSPVEKQQLQSPRQTKNHSLKNATSTMLIQAAAPPTRKESPRHHDVTFDRRKKKAKINVDRSDFFSNENIPHREAKSMSTSAHAKRTLSQTPRAKSEIFNQQDDKVLGPYSRHDKTLGPHGKRILKRHDKKYLVRNDKKTFGRLIKADNSSHPYHSLEEHLQKAMPTKISNSEDINVGEHKGVKGSVTDTFTSKSPTRPAFFNPIGHLTQSPNTKRRKIKHAAITKQSEAHGSMSETFKTSSPIRTKVRRIKGINTDFNDNFFVSHTNHLNRKPSTIDLQSKGTVSRERMRNESDQSSINCDLSWIKDSINTDYKERNRSYRLTQERESAAGTHSKHKHSSSRKENGNGLKPEAGILKLPKYVDDSWKAHAGSSESPLGDSPTDKGISELPHVNETESTQESVDRSLSSPDSTYLAAETQRNTFSNSYHQNYYQNLGGPNRRCINADVEDLNNPVDQTTWSRLQHKDSLSLRDQYVASALKQERKNKRKSRSQDRVPQFHQVNNSAQFFHPEAEFLAASRHNDYTDPYCRVGSMENLGHTSRSLVFEPYASCSYGGMKNNNKPMSNSSHNDSLLQFLHTDDSAPSQSTGNKHSIDELSPGCENSQDLVHGHAISDTCSLQDHLPASCHHEVAQDNSVGAASGDPQQPYSTDKSADCVSVRQRADQSIATSNQVNLDWYKPLSNAEANDRECFRVRQPTNHEVRFNFTATNQRNSNGLAEGSGQESWDPRGNQTYQRQNEDHSMGENMTFYQSRSHMPEEAWQNGQNHINYTTARCPPWVNYCQNFPTQWRQMYGPNSVERHWAVNPIQSSNEWRVGRNLPSSSQAATSFILQNCKHSNPHVPNYFSQNRSENANVWLANNSFGLCRPRDAYCQSNEGSTSHNCPLPGFDESIDLSSTGYFEQSIQNAMSSGVHMMSSLNHQHLPPNAQPIRVETQRCQNNRDFVQPRYLEQHSQPNHNTSGTQ